MTFTRALMLLLASAVTLIAGPSPALAQPQAKVTVSATPSRTQLSPGDQFAIAVEFDHVSGWHIHTNEPKVPKEWADFVPIPTVIDVAPVPGLRFGPIQWPATEGVKADLAGSGTEVTYEVFGGHAIAFIPVIVEVGAAPGDVAAVLTLRYQACDHRQCMMPARGEFTVPLTISATPTPAGPVGATFAGFDSGVFAKMLAGTVVAANDKPVVLNFFGRSIELDPKGALFVPMLLLAAAVGGFLLNLTPCVLPVIPIKIMSLSASSGSRAKCFAHGIISSAGIIAFWLAIGWAIASITQFKAINQLFQYPIFTIGVGTFVLIMAVGMLGVFTVGLPQWVYALSPQKGTAVGSFFFGVLTAVLSTPCTAPFMGGAAAWGATQEFAVTLSTFGAIGFGMALPYAILSAFPSLVSRVPRSGPASYLVKQTIGLLMVAVAIYFIGAGIDPLVRRPIDPPMRVHWWLAAAAVVAAMGWLVYRLFSITKSAPRRVFWTCAAVLLSGVMVFTAWRFTDRGPIAWVAYTPERFEERISKGDVVVVDFTAEWCFNCKTLEATVLHRADIVKLLQSPGVTPMKVDLSGNNEPGQAFLNRLDWVGIPLLAIYGPGLDEPLKYDSYTPDTVREAVERARGGVRAAGR